MRDFTSVAAELNSQLFDGRATNTLRFTYSYQNEPREYDGSAFPTVDILQDGDVYASFGTELFTQGNLRRVSTYVVTDEFNYRAGINNLLVGAQYEHNKATNGFMRRNGLLRLFVARGFLQRRQAVGLQRHPHQQPRRLAIPVRNVL
ncbi:MAG: hypothetical protein ACLS37_08275 [Alistipes sp.]